MAALTDSATTLAELKTRILAFVRERDWEQFHSPKNLSMALAAETGELMEHFLWATNEQSCAIAAEPAALAAEPVAAAACGAYPTRAAARNERPVRTGS